MPAGVAETDDFFPMARATAAGTRPPATNRALAGSVPAPILFSSPFMPNPDLSILVVDDAKFSSAMIGRALSQAGYQDIRFASSASEALQQLEQRPVSVLLADWLMPEMDGLELTARVRQLDESINHYTYIVLLTGKEGENVLGEAFDRGVDDFVSKAAMNEQLVPRIYAADRLCNTLQRLLVENRLLTENIARMEERNLVDTLTGLGNPRYLRQKLADSLRQVETRGGALCYLLVGMPEARIILAEATIAVATAPKSNASYNAINQALADVDAGKIGAVPLYLRNAPTKLMKEWGNHEGYKYAHDWPGAVAPQEYMPEELRGTEYYHPNDRGYEHEVSQRLAKIRPMLHGGEPEQK